MRPIREPLKTLALVFSIIGAAMMAFCVVFFVLEFEDSDVCGFVMLGCGFLFLCVGVGFAIGVRTRVRILDDLTSVGERVTAKVIAVEENRTLNQSGRAPYRLVCRYDEDGETYIIRSQNIYFYPVVLKDTVTVLRDPYNKRRYKIDLTDVLLPVKEL